MEKQSIGKVKLELIRKIVNAKLTSAELSAVSEKAKEIIARRP